jgi:hypothetical protein
MVGADNARNAFRSKEDAPGIKETLPNIKTKACSALVTWDSLCAFVWLFAETFYAVWALMHT